MSITSFEKDLSKGAAMVEPRCWFCQSPTSSLTVFCRYCWSVLPAHIRIRIIRHNNNRASLEWFAAIRDSLEKLKHPRREFRPAPSAPLFESTE